tara:strand:- start:59908 stop:60504 length:597 start_codon:yes stop_codon:yes gene_type:complete
VDIVTMIAIDIAAIAVLVFGLYFPRHRRKDLVVAFLTVNVGVLGVALVLSNASISLGVGLGLFGVLAIIRLRSAVIRQHEIAYYFAALALGLLAGLATTIDPLFIGMMGLIVFALFVGDHPRLFASYRMQTMRLDYAETDEAALTAALAATLGARIHRVTVQHVDFSKKFTDIEVRYSLNGAPSGADRHTPVRTHEGA